RLCLDKVIRNLAHPDRPKLTRTANDTNVLELETRVGEALDQLRTLDAKEAGNARSARPVWDWIFKSDGFFAQYDSEQEAKAESFSKRDATNGSRFLVPWRQPPLWPILNAYRVTLSGRYSRAANSLTWQDFSSDSAPLDKHLYLRFFAETNAPARYTVFWQVVNTGHEAVACGGLRGDIV